MDTVYVVTCGCYSDYQIVSIFKNLEDAEKYCAIQNDRNSYYDPCGIEFWDLQDGLNAQDIHAYKALHCRVSKMEKSGAIEVRDWFMEFSKKPFDFKFKKEKKEFLGWNELEAFEAIIPVGHTYSEKDEKIVEKIAIDSYYMWRALKEGI